MSTTVAVVGGGYGGVTAAKALDEFADVVLIEPRDAFVHNVAILRHLVDPGWSGRLFFPYDRLLTRGKVIHDRAVAVDATGVTLGSGDRVPADYVVLATGSRYPFPAKVEETNSVEAAETLRDAHAALAGATRVLLLGAGPVGLELAGEIKAAWPDTGVTIVDPAPDILGATALPDELRAELRRQLAEAGVELLLGTSLVADPPREPGRTGEFTVTTASGREIGADLWFRCYGVEPATGYVGGGLAAALDGKGALRVDPDLRIPGHPGVFAIGDVTAIPEAKMAKSAEQQAAVVAANIRTLIEGGTELATYTPASPGIALPLGPHGGASYNETVGVLGAEATSKIKGTSLRVESYLELLNLDR
ncbi:MULTISPECIES: FAD-dependent oxidoreductase [unclassified Amycolatopsis]|uniref:FAD-dependent oxidoreductase n=1 Tax=unclassified Amycolatopsis TaxID=2618356 RepID=UPI0028766B5D|nr:MULTISPECIES: FAD-dependent oxidoreductase [unclassified Amycolatopsis]MDS0135827.1 FAD-dependent oxidoreductase [Amycolatopsis sp. 505]MDS0145572.1 FAD-dependent oxidoreductase [Amycolatopsis sp. CM201R]